MTLSTGLALSIHKATRSKSLITKLEEIDLSVCYSKIMEIETAIANAVKKQMDAMNGLCLPSWLVENKFTWFALDNIDFLEVTPSGMNTLHGTAIAIYQAKSFDDPPLLPPLEINRSSKASMMDEAFESVLLTCKKADPPKIKLACTLSDSQPLIDANKTKDLAWLVGCTNIEQSEIEDTGQKQALGT